MSANHKRLIVVYGDCGRAGTLVKMLDAEGIERVTGPHYFEMYADGLSGNILTKVRIVFWRDIPVHVKARNGDTRLSRPLSPRFQGAVHRAAYRAKAISGDEYIKEWRSSDWSEQEGGVEFTILSVIAELEASYSDERLDNLARNKGYEPDDS